MARRLKMRELLDRVSDFGVSFTGDGRFCIPLKYTGAGYESLIVRAGESPGDVRIDLPENAKRAGYLVLPADMLEAVVAAAGMQVDG